MSREQRTSETGEPLAATWHKTACILCECNCGLEVVVTDRALTKIKGDSAHPGSAGYTCEKPLRLDRYQNGPHRLTTPLRRRRDGSFEEISWDTALDEIAIRLKDVIRRHGGQRIFFYGGGGQGNHLGGAYGRALFNALGAHYMSNALAQEKTGEGWVDQQLYGNHTSGDFDRTQVAIFIGKNPWQSHGIARARPVLREMARDPERSIIVIDPRRSETAELADIHLQIKPGTDAWCVSAIAATIVQEQLHDAQWLAKHTTGSHAVLAALGTIGITDHARRCGVAEEQIRAAARRIASATSAATYEDLGVQHSPNSTLVAYLDKMMWMLTGNFAKPGGMHIHSWMVPIAGKWYPVESDQRPARRSSPRRVLGIASMKWGATPLRRLLARAGRTASAHRLAESVARGALTGFFGSVAVPAAQRIADALLHSNESGVTPVTGANIVGGLIPANSIADEILTDHPERLRAIWIDAANPAHSLAESARFCAAMRSLELSVVVDVAITETAQQADYVLPAASQFEKHEASLFTLHFPHNVFQVRHPLMEPLSGTRPEPWVYAEIIDRLDVVDPRLISELKVAAEIGRSAFALALFSAIEAQPQLAGLVPYLLYRTLGTTLPDGEQGVALVWGFAHLCAIAQPDAVDRAGFTAKGFARGEQLFEALRTRREGVMFSDDRYEDAWKYIQHRDGKIHMEIPILLEELRNIQDQEPDYTSKEYPLVLSVGERRSFTANVIIRDPLWRRRDVNGALRIAPADAQRLGVTDGTIVRVVTESGQATTPVEVTETMQPGHISLPNGMGVTYPDAEGVSIVGVPPNSLTSASRRDKFFGSPWHKHTPARVETLD